MICNSFQRQVEGDRMMVESLMVLGSDSVVVVICLTSSC